jgi:hypothetical protein
LLQFGSSVRFLRFGVRFGSALYKSRNPELPRILNHVPAVTVVSDKPLGEQSIPNVGKVGFPFHANAGVPGSIIPIFQREPCGAGGVQDGKDGLLVRS